MLARLASFVCVLSLAAPAIAQLDFRAEELKTQLGVGYAVHLLDMNGDEKLDIVVVDKHRILWLENPTWKEHTLWRSTAETDNVCFAPYDIDQDGRRDFAIGADWTLNTKQGGVIAWITQKDAAQAWTIYPIGEEPTVHRMRFADLQGDGRKELLVLPLLGRNTTRPNFAEAGVRLLAYEIPADPVAGPWKPTVLNDELHVTHNFWPTDFDGDGADEILVASFEGVSLLERKDDGTYRRTLVGRGEQNTSPNRGASEIKRGFLASGDDYLATIEPWHGHEVVVYRRPDGERPKEGDWLWNRQVLDDDLKWGHAVWCANLDGDKDQELIIGVRDDKSQQDRRGLRIYDPQDDGTWKRSVFDPGGVAIEDLAAADLDGDGKTDIVAVGRQTHNVKIYWNQSK